MPYPLAGKRIVITRADAQAEGMVAALRACGASPILFPTIQIVPITPNPALENAIRQLGQFDWVVFTSANGVRIVCDHLASCDLSPALLNQVKVAAIGSATAQVLAENGVQVALVPADYVAESLADALLASGTLVGQRCLLLRAEIVRPTLVDQLIAHGAQVESVSVYHTQLGQPSPSAYAELRSGVDMLTFTSASTVHHFVQLLGAEAYPLSERALVACIGPITAQSARSLGLRVDVIASTYMIAGLLQALEEFQPL